MFLQTKYQQQLQKDTRTTFGGTQGFQQFQPKKPYQPKQKAAIAGSVKLGRINFEQGEQIFPKEDMPHKALAAKNQMLQLVDPDILGLRKKEWNGSVLVPVNAQEEEFERKLTKIKLGFFDTPLPKYRTPKIEPGTELRNNYKGWNVSTETITEFQRQRSIEEETLRSKELTKSYFKKIKDYQNPIDIVQTLNETLRQTKKDEKEFRNQLREKLKFENPSATEERINAGVTRLVYEHKRKALSPQLEDPMHNETFKPDLSRTTKPAFNHYSYHNGSWGTNPASPDKEVWSCCMMNDKRGEGCVKVKTSQDKWNFASYCSK